MKIISVKADKKIPTGRYPNIGYWKTGHCSFRKRPSQRSLQVKTRLKKLKWISFVKRNRNRIKRVVLGVAFQPHTKVKISGGLVKVLKLASFHYRGRMALFTKGMNTPGDLGQIPMLQSYKIALRQLELMDDVGLWCWSFIFLKQTSFILFNFYIIYENQWISISNWLISDLKQPVFMHSFFDNIYYSFFRPSFFMDVP